MQTRGPLLPVDPASQPPSWQVSCQEPGVKAASPRVSAQVREASEHTHPLTP